jgi:pyruvate dehydrogenase E2 component (dihydrolipoamide acetyltransferase)
MSEANLPELPESVIPVLMPQVGNDMEEGTLVKWNVKEGETIEKGQIIFEVETDKATIEIEADAAGRLAKIVASEGEIVPIRQPVAYLGDNDADVEAYLASSTADDASTSSSPSESLAVDGTSTSSASSPPEGVTPVLMPQVGNDMEEGTVVKWVVDEGETVEKGDILFEVETDKATIEIEADADGRLAKIVVPEGQTVPIKTPVAYLGDSDADVDAYIAWEASQAGTSKSLAADGTSASSTAPTPPKPVDVPSTAKRTPTQTVRPAGGGMSLSSGRVKASPAARRFAAERGVDLAAIAPGSGPGGRVISTDVLAAPAGGAAAGPQVVPVSPQGAALGETDIITELPKMRRAIARNLTASKQNVPHFYMKLTVDAGPMMDFYRAQKQQYKLSVNDVIVKTVAATLSEFPAFRSRFEDTQITERPRANVGVAVGTDDGLRVPVVMNADLLSLPELAEESRRVIQNARDGKLENVGEGVFTISNLGMFGIEEFSAIINPPEAAILAVGAVREDVIVKDGAIKPSRVCSMTLSCDHRVVDGLVAAQFAARLKDLLENPELLAQ